MIAIADLIPHAGTMCLLDEVTAWDAQTLCATATSHRLPDNPLRHEGRLGVICGVEYAAQAMAAHGRLTSGNDRRPQRGYLASLRDLTCHADRLDIVPGALTVTVEVIMAEGGRVIYQFWIKAGSAILLAGRAAVMLEPAA